MRPRLNVMLNQFRTSNQFLVVSSAISGLTPVTPLSEFCSRIQI